MFSQSAEASVVETTSFGVELKYPAIGLLAGWWGQKSAHSW